MFRTNTKTAAVTYKPLKEIPKKEEIDKILEGIPKKTKIEKLPEGEIEIWVNKMKRAKLSWLTANSYTINDDDDEKTVIGYDEVKQYLTYAIENGLNDSAVINYAVKVIRNKFILTENAGNYFYKKMLYLAV